jgi:two-component system chemotaxis response regulator CheB
MPRIRVLIVDDSAFMRHALGRLLDETPSLEVVGSAMNGEEGLRLARELHPDVITLDVEMPVLDGLGMLKRLMTEAPTRVVMLSSRTTQNAAVTLDALEFGAIDFVPKPSGSLSIDIRRVGEELVGKIEAAAAMSQAAFIRHRQVSALHANAAQTSGRGAETSGQVGENHAAGPTAPAVVWRAATTHHVPRPRSNVAARKLIVVASSTGGPSALHTFVSGLPEKLGAAVAIVQHMPPGFTASLAGRLDSAGMLRCAEATSEDVLVEDEILVAPGDRHMICSSSGRIQLVHLPPVNGVRPAADVTLQAMAPIWRERLLCIVLTGMGVDACDGARAVKQHGGTVFAQDEATATIYGMPAAVAEAGLTDQVLPLGRLAEAAARWCAQDLPQNAARRPVAGTDIPVPSIRPSSTRPTPAL